MPSQKSHKHYIRKPVGPYETKKFYLYLLNDLRTFDVAQIFHHPVRAEFAPGYKDLVKFPMDFATMRTKIEQDEYTSADAFYADAELIIKNCLLYNNKDTPYYRAALELRDHIVVLKKHVERHIDQLQTESKQEDKEPLYFPPKDKSASLLQKSLTSCKESFAGLNAMQAALDADWQVVQNKVMFYKNVGCFEGCSCTAVPPVFTECKCAKNQSLCSEKCVCKETCENTGARVSQLTGAEFAMTAEQVGLDKKRLATAVTTLLDGDQTKELRPVLLALHMVCFLVRARNVRLGTADNKTALLPKDAGSLVTVDFDKQDILVAEELARVAAKTNEDAELSNFYSDPAGGLESVAKSSVNIYKVARALRRARVYKKPLSVVAHTALPAHRVLCSLSGEAVAPFHFGEQLWADDLVRRTWPHRKHPFVAFPFQRHFEDAGGYDCLFFVSDWNNNFLQTLSHSCEPSLAILSLSAESCYHMCLRTVRSVQQGELLSLDHRVFSRFFAGYRKRVCLCTSPGCDHLLGSDAVFYKPFRTERPLSVHKLLLNTALLVRSASKGLNNGEKIALGKHSLKRCVLEASPIWVKKFLGQLVVSFDAYTQKNLFLFASERVAESGRRVRENSIPHTEPLSSEKRFRKLRCMAVFVDCVKHFLNVRGQFFDLHPVHVLSEEEVLQKVWLDNDSWLRKVFRGLEKRVLLFPEAEPDSIDNSSDFFGVLFCNMVTKMRSFAEKTVPKNGSELRSWLITFARHVQKENKKVVQNNGKEVLRSIIGEAFNFVLFSQLLFLLGSTSCFFELNSYLPVCRRPLSLQEVVHPSDLAVLKSENKNIYKKLKHALSSEQNYSSDFVWTSCLFWQKPFFASFHSEQKRSLICPLTVPSFENCFIAKETPPIISINGGDFTKIFKEQNYIINEKIGDLMGCPWLDLYINRDLKTYYNTCCNLNNLKAGLI